MAKKPHVEKCPSLHFCCRALVCWSKQPKELQKSGVMEKGPVKGFHGPPSPGSYR